MKILFITPTVCFVCVVWSLRRILRHLRLMWLLLKRLKTAWTLMLELSIHTEWNGGIAYCEEACLLFHKAHHKNSEWLTWIISCQKRLIVYVHQVAPSSGLGRTRQQLSVIICLQQCFSTYIEPRQSLRLKTNLTAVVTLHIGCHVNFVC